MACGTNVCPALMVASLINGSKDVQIDYPVVAPPCNGSAFFTFNGACPPGTSGKVNGIQFHGSNSGISPEIGYISTNRVQFPMPAGTQLPTLCPLGSVVLDLGYDNGLGQLWTFDCNGIAKPYTGDPTVTGCEVDVASAVGGSVTGCNATL